MPSRRSTDTGHRRVLLFAGAAALLGLMAWVGLQSRHVDLARRLVAMPPDEVPAQADLVRYGVTTGRPLFDRQCAGCHGADLKGVAGKSVPNLADGNWLYGRGSVSSIERTILYGIRAPNGKTRNIADMPAFGLRGQLRPAEIETVVQYLLQLSHRPADADAAGAGRALFDGAASCADCHGAGGEGNPDYGAPDLTRGTWLYGGDPASLYRTIFGGRHGVMPAYDGRLSSFQIRAIAVYVHTHARQHAS